MKIYTRFFLFLFATAIAAPVLAEDNPKTSVDHLRRFFAQVNSYSARFSQVVLDESRKTIQESSGSLWIERPNRFRWNYDAPFKQQIVSDGRRLWVYDIELQQVTTRPLGSGLSETPAMLLAGRGRLEDNFSVKPLEARDNLDWAQMTPRRKEGGYEDIRAGFANGKLRMMEMVDGFGHTTRITFNAPQENAPIEPSRFSFKPPEGVDVVGE